MSTRNELFPSKYVKHSDLNGKEVAVTIAGLDIEEVGMDNETKPVVNFKDAKKGLILNMTNYDAIAEGYGEETDGWSGKTIVLYGDKTRFGGKIVDCVRVKLPEIATDPQAPLETPAVTEVELNDSIPF